MTLSLARSIVSAALAGLAAWVVYEDWRWRKIRNARILAGLALCAAGYAALALGARGGTFSLPPGFFLSALIHAAISLAVGVAFWLSDVWPPGDAKLFIAASWMLPMADVALPDFPNALFLILLINIFLPCAALLALRMAWMAGCRLATMGAGPFLERSSQRLRGWRRRLGEMRWGDAGMGVSLFGLLLLGSSLRFILPGVQARGRELSALLYLLLFINWDRIIDVVRYKTGERLFYLTLAYLVAGLAFFPLFLSAHVRSSLAVFAGAGLAFLLLRPLLLRGAEMLEEQVIAAGEAREGMLPLEVRDAGPGFDWQALGPVPATGLTTEQALKIRASGAASLTVRTGGAFAFWIVAGAALTLLLRGDVIRLLRIRFS